MKTNRVTSYVRHSSRVRLIFLTPEYVELVSVTINAPVVTCKDLHLRTNLSRSLTLSPSNTVNRNRYHTATNKHIYTLFFALVHVCLYVLCVFGLSKLAAIISLQGIQSLVVPMKAHSFSAFS